MSKLAEIGEFDFGTDSGGFYSFDDASLPADKIDSVEGSKLVKKLDDIITMIQGARRKSGYEEFVPRQRLWAILP